MSAKQLDPITQTERRRRLRRVTHAARRFGFVGRVEYRHVLSNAGGAQFGLGSSPARDLLVVYAEAFLRDADPEDFSLEAVIAHECGHQALCRNAASQQYLPGTWTPASEEVVGSVLVECSTDRESLLLKAIDDAVRCGLAVQDMGLRRV
jgi:hypothetical protein